MRENIGIFRGKRVDTGQWKEGYLLGLQDKISGKDLYDGDVTVEFEMTR